MSSEFLRKVMADVERVTPLKKHRRRRAQQDGKAWQADATTNGGVTLDDFRAFMPTHSYIYIPSREMWPASSVNARLPPVPVSDGKPVAPSVWLAQHRAVEQMTWCPGLPMLIPDRLVDDGGWIEHVGVTCFNLYRPPTIAPGDASKAGPWLDHVRRIYPNEADHIIQWLAHRVQRPQEKINHALVLGGAQGIGKDTLLEGGKRAVGPWNCKEVSPTQILGRFNGFLKSVILRVSEARDLGEYDRFKLYDHMKAYTAAPPDVLRVDEKNLREYGVFNVTGVVITTNHKTDGIYLPADDRRHYVAWSDLTKDDFAPEYWIRLWHWYADGGDRHVADYLTQLDISEFDPKAPPPKTYAFWDIVNASRSPEDAELADVLDSIDNPAVTTLNEIIANAPADFQEWLRNRKNSRAIPHRLEDCGYTAFHNDDAKDGLWRINNKRQVVYAKTELSTQMRHRALKERWP